MKTAPKFVKIFLNCTIFGQNGTILVPYSDEYRTVPDLLTTLERGGERIFIKNSTKILYANSISNGMERAKSLGGHNAIPSFTAQ